MNNLLKFSFLLLLPCVFFCYSCGDPKTDDDNNGPDPIDISYGGKVLCGTEGVAGVVVTDGTNFTVTNDTGAYTMPYSSTATHFYISSPAGYTVPVVNSVPMFWVKLRGTSDKHKINFNLIKLNQSDTKHYFVAVGDPQVRNSTELNKLRPILTYMTQEIKALGQENVPLLVAGDLVFNYPGMHGLSKQYFSAVNQPVYCAIGNHDHVFSKSETANVSHDKTADSVFINNYGPTCYSFNKGMVHYIVLDNIYFEGGPDAEYTTNFTQAQLNWVKKDLSYVTKDKALVLTFHAPIKYRYSSTIIGNSASLVALLSGYANIQIICGHTHTNSVVTDYSGLTEHIVGAACGGFWGGPVCLDGSELGYKVFEVDGTSFKWTYRSYVNPNTQFSAFKPENRDPVLEPANELLVNVWDWDPDWSVTYSEDGGMTYKVMTRISGKAYDPIAWSYFGTEKSPGVPSRLWINASKTDHLFQCVPSTGIIKITVKVVSRFGNVYTQEVSL